MKIYVHIMILVFSFMLLTGHAHVYAEEVLNIEEQELLEQDRIGNDDKEDNDLVEVHTFFYDVPVDHFAYEAINNLYNIGATNYRQDHKFMPDALISRGEFLHMLIKAKGFSPVGEIVPAFTDVHVEVPFASYIDTAYRMGIVDGLGNGQFRPGDPVKRDALLKMLITGTGLLKYDINYSLDWRERASLLSPFKDKSAISVWAEHYITHALKNNLINGYPDNTIRPNQNTTRAEAAVLIDRFFLPNYVETNDTPILNINGTDITYTEKIVMAATSYNSSQPGLTNYTRSGLTTRIGTVAVDPNVIPLGTYLYIENYGYAVAADTGGAIKGNKIDLYVSSVQEARQFGRQEAVIYILP